MKPRVPKAQRQRTIRVRFAWYDLWIGAFYDRAKRTLYVCPLPMLLLVFAPRSGATEAPAVVSREGSG